MYLAIIGFAMVAVIVALLLKGKMSPIVVLITIPTIAALLAGFGISDIGKFIVDGVKTTQNNAVLFIFSITYFGIMTDVGLFDILVGKLVKKAGNNVIAITVVTAIIAIMAHLDGSTACTVLITIPSMYPIYKRMNIRPYVLLLLTASAMGVMNLLPWGGPTMRSASVLGIEANDLWIQLMPMQAVGIVIALVTAFVWGNIEKRRGAGVNSTLVIDYGDSDDTGVSQEQKNELARPQFFWVNLILTLVVILALVFVKIPSYCTFMIGCVIALFVNYPGAKMQNKIIKSHSSTGLMMASTILAAGVFLGVLEQSGIMNHMANVLASFIPTSMGRFLPIIIGVLSVPLTLLFCTDSYFYGLLPVLISVGDAFGVDPAHTAIAMVVCRNCATFISPVVPATFLGVGLAGVEIKDHIKNSFFWIWGVSICCLISGLLLGVIVL